MDLEKAIEEAIEVLKNREYDCKDAVTGAWDVFLCDYFANNSTIVTQSTPIRLTCKCACTDKNCAFMSAQSTSKGKWSIKKIRRRKLGCTASRERCPNLKILSQANKIINSKIPAQKQSGKGAKKVPTILLLLLFPIVLPFFFFY